MSYLARRLFALISFWRGWLIWWSGTLVGLLILALISRQVIAEDDFIFRYLASLYAVNSLLFFISLGISPKMSQIMLGFLINLELIALTFYGLHFISAL